MPYRDISLVSIYGLRGTLYVLKAGNAEGVSVQIEGPTYEARVVDGSWLRIYPEGQELPIRRVSHVDITASGTYIGSMDITAGIRFLTDSGPHARARTSAEMQAVIRITASPGTKFELVDCYGLLRGPRNWHSMRGSGRFDLR